MLVLYTILSGLLTAELDIHIAQILKTSERIGDNSLMAIIKFVEE